MKSKIHKIMGLAVTLGIVLTFVVALLPAAPVAASPAETLNEWYKYGYPKAGSAGDWFREGAYAEDEAIVETGEITESKDGDLYVYVETVGPAETSSTHYYRIFKSTDGGHSWAATGYEDVEITCTGSLYAPGHVFDMVCSSIDNDILYVTDGYYVYKTDDGGETFTLVAQASLEEQLEGECGDCSDDLRRITCIDVGYDDDETPYVYIGTRANEYPGSIYYIAEGTFSAVWTEIDLSCYGTGYECFSIGVDPNFADNFEWYAVVSRNEETHVVKGVGGTCPVEFAELLWDCEVPFQIKAASRIAFPDDFEDSETLFVGVVDEEPCSGPGGDVYLVVDGDATDLNVAGIDPAEGGCVGDEPVDIISLDIKGAADEAELIAGPWCDTNVYYSSDGGWSWDASVKDPTGEEMTYVIWYKDTALAATAGCEAAVSQACVSDDVKDVGESWNQISLIDTHIDMVRWLGFSPGYKKCEAGSETMYMVTYDHGDGCSDTVSVFRNDGTWWERVFLAEDGGDYGAYDAEAMPFWYLEVSPDFLDTNVVYLTNGLFEIFRTTDAGCSWNRLPFPCEDNYWIRAMTVIDEDTVIVGGVLDEGDPTVWKTTNHGTRKWKAYELPTGAGIPWMFALAPGYEDPGSILLGDDAWYGEGGSQVFLSEDGAETWALVGDCQDVLGFVPDNPFEDYGFKTYVAFDPGYPTNPNADMYAAAGEMIARCKIDTDEAMADQAWAEIFCLPDCPDYGPHYPELYASGIAVTGDTVLYVTSGEDVETLIQPGEGECEDTSFINGGVMRSLNPDAKDADKVVFEQLVDGLTFEDTTVDPVIDGTELRRLWLTCDTSEDGCAENFLWSLEKLWADGVDNVWVYEDTLAFPVALTTPVEGQTIAKTDEVTLSWNALCGADCYEVSLWSCPDCPEKVYIDLSKYAKDFMKCHPVDDVICGPELEWPDDVCTKETCIIVDGLDAGTTYYWSVRVCQGNPHLSKWSEERSFTTAMLAVPFAELCSPPCGAQDIVLRPSFSWGPVTGATGYEIQVATTETFTAGVIRGSSTINAWVLPPPDLEYATHYYWRVRAVKDGIYSNWTYCEFITMPEPVPPTPPVVVEEVPPAAPPVIQIPPAQMITPTWIYAIIGVGAALAIVVIVLIVRTRRPPA